MWWKLTGLGLIEAALIVVLFSPVKTHVVRLDMPPGADSHALETFSTYVMPMLAVGTFALVAAILALPIWLAYRVMRAAARGKS
jgi:hypothetical protein